MITLRDVAEAIRKNGLPKTTDNFYEYESGGVRYKRTKLLVGEKPVAACALGQAGLNLDVDAEKLYGKLNLLRSDDPSTKSYLFLGDEIAKANDAGDSLEEIADAIINQYPNLLDTEVMST
jgi:hypothetical protein